jgi:hypothetical protein
MVVTEKKHNVIYHEDYVFPNESNKTINYLNELKNKNEINLILSTNPAKGLGNALDILIKKHIKSKFVFYLQDD